MQTQVKNDKPDTVRRPAFGWLMANCLILTVSSVGRGEEHEAAPAVVNPALRSELRATLSLDGDWDFAVDPKGVGEREKWFSPESTLPERITLRVPGCWEAQGVGGPGDSTSVTPERSIRPLRGSYVGTGWYRKELTLPKDWGGRQVWLKVGGVHAQGWFWVNGTPVAHNACYCGTYKYNITDLVRPGERVVIAVKVRNDVPSRKGLMGWIHRFGGLYRSVELEATPRQLIDDAWVDGDLDGGKATVHVTIRSVDPAGGASEPAASPTAEQADVQVTVAALDGTPAGRASVRARLRGGGTVEAAVPVPLEPLRAWSPEEPNLYRADITLQVDGRAIDGWVERFGVRKWEVRGGEFYLNNRRHFIRGFGDDHIYPLTLCSPASREVHRRHLELARSYGFTYVRHHTHCEVPEYYEAADEVGIMIQPELPYYGSQPSAAAPGHFKPQEDLEELYRHYRRHVSLATYCTGNEGHLGSPIDREVYQLAKLLDPTRLALHQDGGENRRDNSDFRQGPAVPWAPGAQDASWPFTAHEYLNLATHEDPRLAGKYTGAVRPPVTPEDFRKSLAEAGLSWEWGEETLEAGNQLQRVYQKRGLEQARLEPACDGYIYWTIVDVGSPSAQGLFNQFWEPKASSAAFFRQFNGPTAILARFTPPERILTSGQRLRIEWWLSAYGADAVRGGRLTWSLQQERHTLASGEVPGVEAQTGDVKAVGHTELDAPTLRESAMLTLKAELAGKSVRNSWQFWVFPPRPAASDAGKGMSATPGIHAALERRYPGLRESGDPGARRSALLLADRLDDVVVKALDDGVTVLLVRLPGPSPGVEMGWWAIRAQAGTAIARHPAFGAFPHEGYLSELWFRLIGGTVSAADEALREVEPLMVGRGSAGYLLHVFQARAGKGRLLASGLELLSDHPEAAWLLDQLIRYARSDEFQPRGVFDPRKPGKTWADAIALRERLNGWSRTLRAAECRPYGSFLGSYTMCLARQTDGSSELAWETAEVPRDLAPDRPHTLHWVAGTGYISEPAGRFTLFLGDRPLLDFAVALETTTWRSSDGAVSLTYTVKHVEGVDSSGEMELTLPASLLTPGRPARLRVAGSASASQRWFGVYEVR